jgi:nicotinate phosphoribosyltransferase
MIITSLLDTDLYKFTMMQLVLHEFPSAMVSYQFKCRTAGIDYRPYADEIMAEIRALERLSFSQDELAYLSKLPFFKPDFIALLAMFRFDARYVRIVCDEDFSILIEGPWLQTILFEIPILSIINEVYYRRTQSQPDYEQGLRRLSAKIKTLQALPLTEHFYFSDFGTRRRFSQGWQHQVIEQLLKSVPQCFVGTSNVHFAKTFDIQPIGTMAHEYIQACQALGPRLLDSQRFAFDTWGKVYRGELGIALSDTLGMRQFFKDFDLYCCKVFDGIRQDSGDPYLWAQEIIRHYQNYGIDARTKKIIFSDCLTIDKALDLYQTFKDQIQMAFGIGTHLMNDLGYTPIQNVIKMIYCNGQPVAKLSDTPEKIMCPEASYLAYLQALFQ